MYQYVESHLEIRYTTSKVVPKFIKIRKVFERRKQERQTIQEVSKTLADVKQSLGAMNAHYSVDNIRMRDEWMKGINQKLEQNDLWIRACLKKGGDCAKATK